MKEIKSSVIFETEKSSKIKSHSGAGGGGKLGEMFFLSSALFQVGVRTGLKPIPLGSLNSLRLLKRRRRLALIYRLSSVLPVIRVFANADDIEKPPLHFFCAVCLQRDGLQPLTDPCGRRRCDNRSASGYAAVRVAPTDCC